MGIHEQEKIVPRNGSKSACTRCQGFQTPPTVPPHTTRSSSNHIFDTVLCIGPCFIPVNNRSPCLSVSSHSSNIFIPLHNYTGLLFHVLLVINLLILETKVAEQFPQSNSLTIKQTFFNHNKQEFQRRVLFYQ